MVPGRSPVAVSDSLGRRPGVGSERARQCAMMLFAVAAFPLGMLVAAVGAWYAMKSGSFLNLPIAFLVLVACLALVQRHDASDFIALAMLATGLSAWFLMGSASRSLLIERGVELSSRISLLTGLLLSLFLLLVLRVVRRTRVARASRAVLRASDHVCPERAPVGETADRTR